MERFEEENQRVLKMTVNWQDCLAEINKCGGVVPSNRFEVVIFPSPMMSKGSVGAKGSEIPNPFDARGIGGLVRNLEHFKFVCTSSSLQGISLATSEPRHYGPVVKVPYSRIFEDISMTFICTAQNFVERKFFDAWVESIEHFGTHDFNYLTEYAGTAEVYALTYGLKRIYGQKLVSFFPLAVRTTDMDQTAGEPQRVTVNFSYDHWEPIDVGKG